MNIIITGGGTGGHINPALAIGKKLQKAFPYAKLLYVGGKRGMEGKLVPEAGFDYTDIPIMGFDRNVKSVRYNLRALKAFFQGRRQIKQVFRSFSPDLVVGTGGYVSYPVLHLAAKRKIPTVLHESNAYPGLTTKLLAPEVDLVLGAVPIIKERIRLGGRFAVTGNPVREAFLSVDREKARAELAIPKDAFLTVSSGGSLGAVSLNEAVADLFAREFSDKNRWHIHSVGRRNGGDFARLLQEKEVIPDGKRLVVEEFIRNMPQLYAAADLIISRSGAISLAEIQCSGRAAILIPSPNVTENHQYHNAKVLSDQGAAILLEEKDLSGEHLIAVCDRLAADKSARREMERAAASMAVFDAPDRILNEIRILLEEKKQSKLK